VNISVAMIAHRSSEKAKKWSGAGFHVHFSKIDEMSLLICVSLTLTLSCIFPRILKFDPALL